MHKKKNASLGSPQTKLIIHHNMSKTHESSTGLILAKINALKQQQTCQKQKASQAFSEQTFLPMTDL